MSSFVCSPEQFNSVEYSLSLLISRKDFPIWHKDYQKIKSYDVFDNIKNVVDIWRDLSVVCVTLQYAHHYDDVNVEIAEQREILLTNHKSESLSIIQLFKALQCIHYQIEISYLKEIRELTSDENFALGFLDFIIEAIALHIIQSLPEYKAAQYAF